MLLPTLHLVLVFVLLASTSFAQVVNPTGSWVGATVAAKEGLSARTWFDMAVLFVLYGVPILLIVVVALKEIYQAGMRAGTRDGVRDGVRDGARWSRLVRGNGAVDRD
ncbi:hypothetical protein M427DRAFT_39197 [Gonapodya prolifera JEL478]|uniref:Uncharacterized protein n=1 Tax=Gonapodya prolifera (strain JEL478) TaxID=1344416 RepID=A0A138ZXP2_GONPJ|nr:hypothetical protein M427DRAFT_39197 [Gonapodya prolifera JEL478]|eukprot:KXS09270.1 hypothetical protein M427DRAFT_39197 [Gonapodya prolifera JEL478]